MTVRTHMLLNEVTFLKYYRLHIHFVTSNVRNSHFFLTIIRIFWLGNKIKLIKHNQPLNIGSGEKSSSNSSLLAPAGRQQSFTSFSPYLNYDPRLLQQAQPEFIFPEGASKQRGRFELAFSQIGSAAMIGASIGGVAGLYNGIIATNLANQTGKLRRTQLINHVMKQGSATANTLGAITVMYSAFGVLLQFARGTDDEVNTVIAGTATGLLYKSTAGLKRCAIGGGIGMAASTLYCLYTMFGQSDKKKQMLYG